MTSTSAYKIKLEGDVLKVGFGEPAQNNRIVQDTATRLEEMTESGELRGGSLLKIDGQASMPVVAVLVHKVAHLYGATGCYDPKLLKYVVVITHDPRYKIGDLLD